MLEFNEEPKYEYIKDSFKRAYEQEFKKDQTKQFDSSIFANPVFDWNVSYEIKFQISLASKARESLKKQENEWVTGEAKVHIGKISHFLMCSRMFENSSS